MQDFVEAQQLLALSLHQPGDGNPRPPRHDLGDLGFGYLLAQQSARSAVVVAVLGLFEAALRSGRRPYLSWAASLRSCRRSASSIPRRVSSICSFSSRTAPMACWGYCDTTGRDLPDLLQCFRLGLFAGKRSPWRVMRTERAPLANEEVFSSVPLDAYAQWNTHDELADSISRFLSP